MFRTIKNEISTLRYHRAHAAMAVGILRAETHSEPERQHGDERYA